MTGRMRRGAALLAAALLAGCSSGDPIGGGGSSIETAVNAAVARLTRIGTAAAAPPQPPALTRAFIDAYPTPVIFVTLEATGARDAVGEAGQNGGVRVYVTPTGLLFALRDGVLVATRGLGPDLMASDAPTAAALRRGDGSHRRVQRYLTGTNATDTLVLECFVTEGGAETLDLVGLSVPTRIVAESCAGRGYAIENRYWFDARGRVRQARQWAGLEAGYIVISDLTR
ncbi:MAG: YjbF family lipoprotein [Gemmobacter sp.]